MGKECYVTFKVTHEIDEPKVAETVRKYLFDNVNRKNKLPDKIESIVMVDDNICISKREYLDFQKCKKTTVIKEAPMPVVVTDSASKTAGDQYREVTNLICPYCNKGCSSASGLTLHKKNCKKKP